MVLYRYVMIPVSSVIGSYYLWREWRQIRGGTTFTADEQTVLGSQMILLLPVLLGGLLWFLHPLPYLAALAARLGFGVSLVFIALTSIIYRVSILGTRGQRGPQRGAKAIVVGVTLLFIMLATFLITQVLP